MSKPVVIGEVSHGTMRSADLIDSFTWELRHNTPDGATVYADLLAECAAWKAAENDESAPVQDIHEEQGCELVNELIDALQDYAPPYCYFGTNEGDGSSYGFWPCINLVEELPRVSGSHEAAELGEDCVFVNDHGNVTLYDSTGKVIWDIV